MKVGIAGLTAIVALAQGRGGTELSLRELRSLLRDAGLPTTKRQALLETFLAGPKQKKLAPSLRKSLLVQLARFELANRRPRAALVRFERVASTCKTRDVDLLAACRLGVAQANALLGLRREAARLFAEVDRDFPGTRYARIARAAIGKRGSALLGRSVLPDLETNGLPALCVFVSASDDRSPATLAAILDDERIAERCELVLVVCGRGPGWQRRYEASAFARAGHARLVTRGSSRGDPLLARLGIRTLPSWLLLSTDGRCVDSNPSLLGLARLVGAPARKHSR